jgi:hypothetical protein
LTPAQRQRFIDALVARREQVASRDTSVSSTHSKPKRGKTAKSPQPKTSKPIAPLGFDDGADIVRIRPDRTGLPSWVSTNPNDLGSTRPAPKPDSIAIGADGRIRVWQGKRYAKFRPGFQVSRDRNFEYGVEYKGINLTLNKNKVVYKLLGETVQGVPESLTHNLNTAKPQSLFYNLARTMSFVEGGQPPSPTWQPAYNRVPDKSVLYKGKYGKIEIHHIEQWAKEPFERINRDYESGKISLDEAKERTRNILKPATDSSSGYAVDIKGQDTRKFVLLAAGSHNFTSPLYEANHPLGYHPDTGEKVRFGIPKTGSGGRGEYDKWRPKFWREVYRREAFIIGQEINRRVARGEISREDVDRMWQKARIKVDKNHENTVRLKKDIKRLNPKTATDTED